MNAVISGFNITQVLFPCVDCDGRSFELLLPLTGREVTDLLERMALADRLWKQRHGPHELVYQGSLMIQYPRPYMRSVPPLPFAVAADPAVATRFFPAVPGGYAVSLHVSPATVHLIGTRHGRPFESTEAIWGEIMRCRLASAQRRMVPKLFRELASVDPWTALEILEADLLLEGSIDPVREIRPLLSPADVVPLLEWGEPDVRERAIAAMGRLTLTA